MNWLDILLALILCASFVAGFLRGIARMGIGIAAAVIGLILGIWFYGSAGAFFLPYLSSRGFANFAGFLVVFFGVLMLGSLAGWLLAKLLKWAGLGWLDRLLGAAFGFLRGLLISIAIVLALVAFAPKPPPQSVVDSRIAPYVIDAARIMVSIAPRELRDGFEDSYERVKSIWRETLEKSRPRAPREEL